MTPVNLSHSHGVLPTPPSSLTMPLNTIHASSLVLCRLTSSIEMSERCGCPPRPLRLGFCFTSRIQSIGL